MYKRQAQRRLENAVLQHGSILVTASKHAPELPGLNDLANDEIQVEELISEVANYVAAKLELDIEEVSVDKTEILMAEKIELEKFGNRDWTLNR